MKCIRCNKEIQDGEGNLCEECRKKYELSQSTSQNASEKKVNLFNKFYSNNVKTYLTQKEKIKTLAIIIGIIIIILFILGAARKGGGSSDIISKVGNLREYGYADKDGGWIYYISPDEELTKMGIYKVKENGSKKTELKILGDQDIMSLNVYKGYIYFIVQNSNSNYSREGDTFDNKIYRMKTDGSDLEAINDNDLHNNCEVIYVLNDSIYYVGTDAKLYKMSLNGKNKVKVSEEVFSTVKPANNYVVTDKYILFNKDNSRDADTPYSTMMMNIEGKDLKPVADGDFMQYIDVDSNYIYFTDSDNALCKVSLDNLKKKELYSNRKIYHLNVKGKYAYFYSYTDNSDVALFRINLNEADKGAQPIKVLTNTMPCLNIVGNRLYYTDRDETGGFAIKLLNIDNVDETPIDLYTFDYENDEEGEKDKLEDLKEDIAGEEGESGTTPNENKVDTSEDVEDEELEEETPKTTTSTAKEPANEEEREKAAAELNANNEAN